MKTTSSVFPVLSIALALSACSSPTVTLIEKENMNPITASRYGDELADMMANLVIKNDPVIQKPGMRALIDKEIQYGKNIGDEARSLQERGMKGGIIALAADTQGLVLSIDDMLYLSSDFFVKPGPDLHAYLTTVVDPRDVSFPDKTAIDLGVIQNVYGASQYVVPHQKDPALLRTFVLFDKKLSLLYGFSQLSK